MKVTYVFIALVAAAYVDERSMVTATSAEAREQILARHNEMRNNVNDDIGVAASDMMKMNYDTSLEADAQAYASKCVRVHGSSGENLYYSWGGSPREPTTEDFLKATNAWWKEKFVYTYGGDNTGKVVGHYTQEIWWNSDRIGCGVSFCAELTHPDKDAYKNAIFVVCRYKESGNYVGANPFTEGSPKCKEFDPTYTNLCIPCKEATTTCIDGGKWNVITCQCDCPADGTNFKHLAPNCKQEYDCSAISDKSTYCSHWEQYCTDPLYKAFMENNCLHYCNCR